jgi:hypothetical protein
VCTCYIDSRNYLINNLFPRAFSDADSATKVCGLQQWFLGTLMCGEITIKEVILHKSIQVLAGFVTVLRIVLGNVMGNMFGTGLSNLGGYFGGCIGESFGEYVRNWFG